MSDNIKSPVWYTDCSMECIDAMRIAFGTEAVYGFCKMNAFKYLWRHCRKNGIEDLQKARQYLDMAKGMNTPDGQLMELIDTVERYGRKFKTEVDEGYQE